MAVVFTEDEAGILTPGQSLYNRACELTVGGTRWTDIRVQFKVNKSLKKNPNPAEITISNLSATSRGLFVERGTPVVLRAGYQNSQDLLYTGQIVDPNIKREGAEWTTTVTCRDGDAAWLSYTSHSWGAGVPRVTVMQALAADLGYTLSPDAQALIGAYGSTRTGIVTHGHTWQAIDNVLRPLGLGWSIQDGELQIIDGGGSTAETAVLLTPRTGLLQVPERMGEFHYKQAKRKGKPNQIKVVSLLQAAIRPGRQVRVESETITGTYVCQTVEHAGDTHGPDWTSTAVLQEVL